MKLNEQHVYFLGALALILTSIFSTGAYHPDEHFQILEFAGTKLGLTETENLPWEYSYQMRAAFQPAIAVSVYRFWELFGFESPFFVSFLLRFISAILSFLAIRLLYNTYKDEIKDVKLKKWYLILSFLLWFLIFNAVRFSSENWSGIFFVFGFSLFFLLKKKNLMIYFLLGILLGISFLCRYQAVLLSMGFLAWLLFIKREKLLNLSLMVVGIIVMALMGILIDRWFYEEWTLTIWHYFEQNILYDKVSGFGIDPWWYYVSNSFMNGIPPFSLLFIWGFFAMVIFRYKRALVWSIVPLVLIHSIIGHKELRFLFPIVLFAPFIIIQGIKIIKDRYTPNLTSNRYMVGFMSLFLLVNLGVLIGVVFSAATSDISLYKRVYTKYPNPTSLYYINENPYGDSVFRRNFYKRESLSIIRIDSVDKIPETENNLVVLTNRTDRPGSLIYSSYPDWILKYNFNGWQGRSSTLYVYELE